TDDGEHGGHRSGVEYATDEEIPAKRHQDVVNDGDDRANGEREFVAEGHINQDAEHGEQGGDDGGLLDFLADDRAFLADAQRLIAKMGVREFLSESAEDFVRDGGIVTFGGLAGGHLQGIQTGGKIFLVGHQHFASADGSRDFADLVHARLVRGIDLQDHFFTAGELDAQDAVSAIETSEGKTVDIADQDQGPGEGEGHLGPFHEIQLHRRRNQMEHVQFLDQISAEEEIENEPRDDQRGEQAGGDTDGQRDAESFHRTGAHENQNDGRNQRRDVRVENGAEGAVIAGFERATQGFALGRFLANALENQHVGVDGHTYGEHDTGDAGQGQRGVDGGHDAQQDDDVEDQRHIRDRAGDAVINQHEAGNQNDADDGSFDAAMNGVFAEGGIDGVFIDDMDGLLQRVLQHVHECARFVFRVIARDFAAALQGGLDDGSGL